MEGRLGKADVLDAEVIVMKVSVEDGRLYVLVDGEPVIAVVLRNDVAKDESVARQMYVETVVRKALAGEVLDGDVVLAVHIHTGMIDAGTLEIAPEVCFCRRLPLWRPEVDAVLKPGGSPSSRSFGCLETEIIFSRLSPSVTRASSPNDGSRSSGSRARARSFQSAGGIFESPDSTAPWP